MTYKILNGAVIEKSKSEGWSEIQESGMHLWGYKTPKDVMPQPIPMDASITDICQRAGATIGASGEYVAEAIACLIKTPDLITFETIGSKIGVKPRIKQNKKARQSRAKNARKVWGFR
ncbi:hypothetical protein [Nostoc sp.]|uniref:hypothetical protein n=1 Tax=Nostoc sp. TaxID=1180 RepID=UPI002FF5F2DC